MIMANAKDDHDEQLYGMRKSLYQVEGGERLKLWMEYSKLQGEGDDPQKHVGQILLDVLFCWNMSLLIPNPTVYQI